MHDHADMTSCDDQPDRLSARLRYVAHALAYAASGKWLLARLASMFIFLANLRAHALHGRTAVVRPSRSGGADHSARAVLRQRNPMVFGGAIHAGDACGRVSMIVRVRIRKVPEAHGWIATRRVVAALFPLRWPPDCSAHEAR